MNSLPMQRDYVDNQVAGYTMRSQSGFNNFAEPQMIKETSNNSVGRLSIN
jgi:hypothetical protein